MAADDIRSMSVAELRERETAVRKEIVHLQLARHTRRLERPSELHGKKKQLAQVLTQLTQKMRAAQQGAD